MSEEGDQSPNGAERPLQGARPKREETLQAIASSTGYPRPNGVTQRIPRGGRGVSAAAETSWGSGGSMPETVALRLSILETNLSRLSETVGRLVPLLEENLQKEPSRYGAEREPSKEGDWSQRGQRASTQSPVAARDEGDEEYWRELEFRDRMAREVERQRALGTLRPPSPTELPTPRMGVGVERPLGPGIGSSGLADEGGEERGIQEEEEDVPYDEERRDEGATARPVCGWAEEPTAAADFREPRRMTTGVGRGVFQGAARGNLMQPFPMPPRQHQRAAEWMPRREDLKLEYGGESDELNFFLISIRGYMEDNAHTFPSEASRVRAIGNTLKRGAASWYVQLHARRDPCLRSVPRFLAALENRFRDRLEQLRARDQLKGIKQRDKTVPEYAEEFLHLAERVPEWSEVTKVELFKEGLRPEIFSWAAHRDDPETLQGWIQLAGRVESTLAQVKRFRSGSGQQRPVARGRGETRKQERPGGRPGIPSRGDDNKPKPGCFVCGKTGHRAAECWARKGEPPKAPKPKPATGRRAEEEVQAPESSEKLVSRDNRMIVVPICLSGLENRATCKAFVDCGCSRNIITPELAGALKCQQMALDSPIAFSQLDGSVAAGEVSTKEIRGIPCKIGKWGGRISFVIAPIATYHVILGIPWLEQANPEVDWRGKSLAFKEQQMQWEISKIAEEEDEEDEAGEIDPQLLPPEYRDFVDVFNQKEASKLPPKRNIEVEIEITPGANLPKPKVYPMSVQEKEELRKYIDKNLARGFIKPSNSPLGAPVLFRRKKDNSLRLCIDYRNLNAITKDNKYPMPLVKDLITVLKKGSIFTKLDLIEAYHKLRIKPEDTWKTAFSCAFGHFEYEILPFGLKNGGGCFMQLINEILHPLLYRGVFIFLDDILIVTEDKEKHVKLVREVLQRLREAKLYAKLSKCEFNKTQIDFLGYRISPEGLAMDPAKVADVKEWGVPQTRRQLQSFLGFANFYRPFIKGFAQITAPLTELLKTKGKGETAKVKAPGAKLSWTPECQKAFETLKECFTEGPILKHPDIRSPFIIHCDASDCAYGAVLLQKDQNGNLKPCGYLSRKFSETEKSWPIWEKEALAILKALECWRHFLEGSGIPFEIWSDHKNLQYLKSPRKLSPKQIRWAQYFSRFDFQLKFFQGKQNVLADALSRMPQHEGITTAKEGTIFSDKQWGLAVRTRAQTQKEDTAFVELGGEENWGNELKQSYEGDQWIASNAGKGEQKGGFWFVNKKLYIPAILRIKILHRFHNNQSAGHTGITKTTKAIVKHCWWPGMRKDIKNHIVQCDDCARNKSGGGKPMGLLQTVAEPTRPWECVAMDFVGELPVSKGHRYIWTVLDLFSKQAHFIALTKLPSAEKLAELYINHIYKLHGCPSRVVSDRGVQFTAKFWEKFLEMLGAERSLSSAFHPMTNGAVERTQQTLGQFLRMYSNMRQNDWSRWLAFAELAFNSTIHSATNKTPFEVVYGYEIQPLPQLPRWTENEETEAGKWKTQMLECWSQVTASLKEAHKKYKAFADRKRVEGDKLNKGDLVWLSTQNIKLGLPSRKLGPKYIGPFRIQGVINEVTFQLALPKSLGKIHPVFHRSLLKKYMGTLDKMDT
uniref:Gypsy retrotransposon integrase-like protein 1 n=1 Tax=Anolis carolinensis TaxID=28377 RepID=A0A803U1T3_ANOCA